jgi:hypothetical protein
MMAVHAASEESWVGEGNRLRKLMRYLQKVQP